MEIVINNCFGGFGLSNLALKKYVESKGMKAYEDFVKEIADYIIQTSQTLAEDRNE